MNSSQDINFDIDQGNLYREESITDLKVASIRRMVPIKPDGSDDASRNPMFVGHTQLMTPEGPLPIQARLMANNLEEAYAAFPGAMKQALEQVIDDIQKMQQQTKEKDDSRIIMPGR